MATITIRTNAGKIYAEPDERIGTELFRTFRRNGWLWSGRETAFCFNDNENGARRVRALFSGAWLNCYGISEETKQEGSAIAFEYADEQTQTHFEQANAEAKAKAEAEKAEKERKKEQAINNKITQIQKILQATKDAPNGWLPKLKYGFMIPITTTAEFFERGGLIICESVKTLAEQLGVTVPDDLDIDDNDVLQLVIKYDFYDGGYNYWSGGKIPARRDMVLSVCYYRKDGTHDVMTAHSGNFSANIILGQNLKQRTLVGYKKYAEICGDDVKRIAVQLYIMYCLRNDNKAVQSPIHESIAGNGTATLDELRKAFVA